MELRAINIIVCSLWLLKAPELHVQGSCFMLLLLLLSLFSHV